MARFPLNNLATVSAALFGFFACTFGADDFQIVPADGAGATSGNAGSSGSDAGGDGPNGVGGDGMNPVGGSDTVPGTSGAGGSGEPPLKFTCTPQAATFDVFTPTDIGNSTIQDGPVLAATTNAVVVLLPTSQNGLSRLYYRAITDSQGGNVDSIGSYDIDGGRINIAAAAFNGNDLNVLAARDAGVFELTVPTKQGGRQFDPPNVLILPQPNACSNNNNPPGSIRDIKGSYVGGTRGYAVTCNSNSDALSLHLYSSDTGMVDELAPPDATAIDNIIRGYVKLGDEHFMMVGSEVGNALGVRHGITKQDLQTVHEIGLSKDPLVLSAIGVRPQLGGMFVWGAAFTNSDDVNVPPPFVPADIFVGSVTLDNLSDLFIDGGGGNVPPAPLKKVATYTKSSQLVGIDDALPLGDHVLAVGASVFPSDHIAVSFFTKDGTVLSEPTEVYRTEGNALIVDHSVSVARLGLGVVTVWLEDSTVKARMVTCLQD